MKVLDLFSGIGGFSLGLQRAGHETIAFCENNEDCRRVLNKHWPGVPVIGDIRDLRGSFVKKFYGRPGIVCGGFPCQNISVAGDRGGLDGEKSGLWNEFSRVIYETKPRWAIVENVANLKNNGLAKVLSDLDSIGYDCQWHIIPATITCAPHLRERIFIIAHAKRKGLSRLWESLRAEKALPEYKNPRGLWFKLRRGIEEAITEGETSWENREYSFSRDHDGLPPGVDSTRIRMLGNAVVPKIVEIIGRAIKEC